MTADEHPPGWTDEDEARLGAYFDASLELMSRMNRERQARASRIPLTYWQARTAHTYDMFSETYRLLDGSLATTEQVYQGVTKPVLELTT